MLEIYKTPLDFLYLILSISVGLLTVFLIMALFHVNSILNNLRKVSEKAKDTVDLFNHYLWQPIRIMMILMEKMKSARQNAKAKREAKHGTK